MEDSRLRPMSPLLGGWPVELEQELVDSDLSSPPVSTSLGCLVQSRIALEGP